MKDDSQLLWLDSLGTLWYTAESASCLLGGFVKKKKTKVDESSILSTLVCGLFFRWPFAGCERTHAKVQVQPNITVTARSNVKTKTERGTMAMMGFSCFMFPIAIVI